MKKFVLLLGVVSMTSVPAFADASSCTLPASYSQFPGYTAVVSGGQCCAALNGTVDPSQCWTDQNAPKPDDHSPNQYQVWRQSVKVFGSIDAIRKDGLEFHATNGRPVNGAPDNCPSNMSLTAHGIMAELVIDGQSVVMLDDSLNIPSENGHFHQNVEYLAKVGSKLAVIGEDASGHAQIHEYVTMDSSSVIIQKAGSDLLPGQVICKMDRTTGNHAAESDASVAATKDAGGLNWTVSPDGEAVPSPSSSAAGAK